MTANGTGSNDGWGPPPPPPPPSGFPPPPPPPGFPPPPPPHPFPPPPGNAAGPGRSPADDDGDDDDGNDNASGGNGAPGPGSPLPTGNLLNATIGAALYAVFFGALTGYFRLLAGFVIGIQGMVAGGFTGTATGKLLAACSWPRHSFRLRIILSILLAVAFVGGELIGMGLALPTFDPGFLVKAIVDGSFREMTIGISRNNTFVRQMDFGWWLLFNLLDLTFLAVGILTGMTMQVFPDESHRDGSADPGWSPWVIAALFTALFAAWWVGFADERRNNREVIAQWYGGAWTESANRNLEEDLQMALMKGKTEELQAKVDRLVEGREGFPEGFAVRGALHLQHGRVPEALRDYTTAIGQAASLTRNVEISFMQELHPAVYGAYLHMCRGKIRIKAQDWQGAADDFSAAIAVIEQMRRSGGNSNLFQAEGGFTGFPKLLTHQGFIVEFHTKIPGYSEGMCFFGRAVARAKLGDTENAKADLTQARGLGYDIDRKKRNQPGEE
ncbi:MAG: hypothetical protein GX442_14820 [Candidatus Riflebacteria bacterium]|nr:hypothetical protein [Candidatus Riflebacteria bacterium]